MKKIFFAILLLNLYSCKESVEKFKPTYASITESVYASGVVKSAKQYNVFAKASGSIETIYVKEGDMVKKGNPLISLSNEVSRYNMENAKLNAAYSDAQSNQDKLNEARQFEELQKSKMKLDSSMWARQQRLWDQNVGTKVELEQRELNYKNSKSGYQSARVRHEDLKKQIALGSNQSKNLLSISKKMESDFTIKSEIDGMVFSLQKEIGDMVTPQVAVALIGDPTKFILEMQVDEYDIFKVTIAQRVFVKMDSYKGKVFEAKINKISPVMNERSKTFLVEAAFIDQPSKLFPYITFEGNIEINTKQKALLIPRNLMLNDSTVKRANGELVQIKTGLMDAQFAEIISGLTENDELILPKK
ncbi:MAG: efflux RND transporter periplasmic adaptor subunit [bacterium]|nr:efflux RND transporter periplasmic adaptor subunit [bacterium]